MPMHVLHTGHVQHSYTWFGRAYGSYSMDAHNDRRVGRWDVSRLVIWALRIFVSVDTKPLDVFHPPPPSPAPPGAKLQNRSSRCYFVVSYDKVHRIYVKSELPHTSQTPEYAIAPFDCTLHCPTPSRVNIRHMSRATFSSTFASSVGHRSIHPRRQRVPP